MENYLVDGGRMILGPSWCDSEDSRYKSIKKLLDSGIAPSGYIEKTHYKNPNRLRRAVWFDKGSAK